MVRSDPVVTWSLDNVTLMSIQRHDVASTLMRNCIYVMCPLGKYTIGENLQNVAENVKELFWTVNKCVHNAYLIVQYGYNTAKFNDNMDGVKRKSAFRYAKNAQIQIILLMRTVSSGLLLFIGIFYNTQWFLQRAAKALIRLCIRTVWSGPSLSAYAWRHVFDRRGPYIIFFFILYAPFIILCRPVGCLYR